MELSIEYILIAIVVIVVLWWLFKPMWSENFDITKISTPQAPIGDNKLYNLAPLDINCKNQGVNQFTLSQGVPNGSETSNNIQYDYSCSKDVNFGQSLPSTTPPGPNQSLMDLTKQYIDCQGKPIVEFQLKNVDANNVQYSYTCGSIPLTAVKDYTTDWKDYGTSGQIVNLDKQNVNCGSDQVLSSIKVAEDAENKKLRYEFKCGVPQLPPAPPGPQWYETTPFRIIVVIIILLLLSSSAGSIYNAMRSSSSSYSAPPTFELEELP